MIYIWISVMIYLILCLFFSKNRERFLEFIHIPKNAGTTIENIANDKDVKWGRYKPEHEEYIREDNDKICTYWHLPPKQFKQGNFYEKDKTFCVVRDPYKRLISEYAYRNMNNPAVNDKRQFNKWLRYNLTPENFKGKAKNCHFIPQYEYIYDNQGNRTCDHILDFENLTNEFNALMEKENIDVHLDATKKDNKSEYTLRPSDIDTDNMSKIYDVYQKDFELLQE